MERDFNFCCGAFSARARVCVSDGVLSLTVQSVQPDGNREQLADLLLGAMMRTVRLRGEVVSMVDGGAIRLSARISGNADLDAALKSIGARWNAARPAIRSMAQLLMELERRGWSKRDLSAATGLSYPRLWALMQENGGWPRVAVFLKLNEWLDKQAPDLAPTLAVLEMEARKVLGGNFYRASNRSGK